MLRNRSRSARARRALVALSLVGGAFGVGALTIGASTPSAETIAVPSSAGQTVTTTWTGTIPAASVHANDCNTVSTGAAEDAHTITLTVPDAQYATFDAELTFSISWTPASPDETTSDEVLTVNGPGSDAGDTDTTEVGSSDGSSTQEQVVAHNLKPGTYQVLACGFANALDQPYTGKLTIRTTPKAAETTLPSADAQGLQFGAAVPVDAQRDEAEPLVEIDRAGNIYACGPTGFSNASDYAQVSTDGGDQFHLLGAPPRGQQGTGGGGDCALATGVSKNGLGFYQYAYAGLDALNGFTTSTSADGGHTIASGGPNGNGLPGATTQGLLADRQWLVFLDDHTVLLNYNQQVPRNVVVQRSTNGGLTYSPDAAVAAPDPDFPGPLRFVSGGKTVPDRSIVYFPWTKNESVNLAVSKDGGATWTNCNVARGDTVKGGTAGFAVADHDTAGNVYVVWADKASYHTWMAVLPAARVGSCTQPIGTIGPLGQVTAAKGDGSVAGTPDGIPTLQPGFSTPVQVDRDAVRTTVFPWVAAGGAAGRVAVAFYGTTRDGDPNTNQFKAAWNVYVNQSLNALDASRTFSQVQATTHPFHYDSICLNGLACDTTNPGDRSLADFFAIALNPRTHRLTVVFDRGNKKPDEAAGHVATTMATTQTAGPTNAGGTVTGRAVVRSSTSDPLGDALAAYSALGVGSPPPPPPTKNEPAGDLRSVAITGDKATKGFTVTLKVADLSAAALQGALTDTLSQSLVYLFRFTNGYQDAGVTAAWSPVAGWTFGFDQYSTGGAPCESASAGGDKCQVYPQSTPIAGSVDAATGTIKLVVPRTLLKGLSGADANGRPLETPAATGTRLYDGTAFSLGNTTSTVQAQQTFLYPLDETAAMDFLLP